MELDWVAIPGKSRDSTRGRQEVRNMVKGPGTAGQESPAFQIKGCI